MKNSSLCAFLSLAIFPASASAVNLFSNPSFEDGSGAVTFSGTLDFGGANALELSSISTVIDGWTWEQSTGTDGGAAWIEDSGDLFQTDGDHLLFLDVHQCIQWNDAATPLSPGSEVEIGYNFASWERGQDFPPAGTSSGEGSMVFDYNYLDANDIRVFGTFSPNPRPPANNDSSPGDLVWLSDSDTLTIPVDYVSDFNLLVSTNGGGVLVDDLSLTVVPEPAIGSFLGLVGLVALMRRRR